MEDSIFTKIIKGEVPAHKLYEDDKTIAFLTIQPVREGHTLVVPKTQVDQYMDLPDEDYDAMWRTVKKVATHLRAQTGKERIGIVIKGIDVPHAHVHLIPFDKGESLKADGAPEIVPNDVLASVAEKLRL
jgi:histidine triad (HIT) family protein